MKVGGQILWNVTPICETSQIYCLMGRRPMKDVLGSHLKDLLFLLVHLLSVTLQLRKISPESINLERKFHLDCSSDTLCTRGEFGRVTYWSQTLRSWRRWTHRKSARKDSMRKRWHFPNKENLIFQQQMDESKPQEETRTWEHPPWYGIDQFKERVILTFLENQKGLPQPHDSLPDAGEAINDSWSMSGSFIHRHHVEPRVKLCSPREESFPVPLKYIDVTRTAHTNLDVKQEKRIDDYWNVDGSRDLSDSWTGFTQFTQLDEKAPDGHTWSGGRSTRKQLTSRPDHLWPELWKSMGKNAKLKEKQKWAEEKIHLENARKLRGICFIDPEDTEFEENHQEHTWEIGNVSCSCCALQNYEELWEWRIWQKLDKTCVYSGSQWIHKNAYGEIWTTSSSRPYCRKGWKIHCSMTTWIINSLQNLKLWKFQQQKPQWTRNRKHWRKFRRGTWRKSKVRNKWSRKQGWRALQFISHH